MTGQAASLYGQGEMAETRPWVCPECGSAELRVFYDERRVARVVDCDEDCPEPWPSPDGDELVTIDPDTFTFICVNGDCGAVEIRPVRRGADARTEGPQRVRLQMAIEEQPFADSSDDTPLYGTCVINGVRHHITLFPVQEHGGTLRARTHEDQMSIEALMSFDGADGPYWTVADDDGRQYVCAITPYGR